MNNEMNISTAGKTENDRKEWVKKKLEEHGISYADFIRVPGGGISLEEYLEFKSRPAEDVVRKLQDYYRFLAEKALRYRNEDGTDDGPIFKANLKIFDEDGRETTDLADFMECLMKDLPRASHFSVRSSFYGDYADYSNNEDPRVKIPLYDHVSFSDCENAEDIIYKNITLYPAGLDGDFGSYEKFEDGKWVDLDAAQSQDILDKDYGNTWWDGDLSLVCKFDFEKYPEILEALQNAVRSLLPTKWAEHCEREWEENGYEYLVFNVGWETRKLRDVQNFLDEVNRIIAPIKDECDCYCMGTWYITHDSLAFAKWDWFDDGFKVFGAEL